MAIDKNQHILDFFKKAIGAEKLAHGYLFWGPDNIGKKDTAFWLADFLKINPFDVLYIGLEEGKKDISIDQIRKAKKHLSLSSYNSPYKFAIINRAEAMNIEASNALLKTLEEPQGKTVLILITSKPDLLPKTILSRLQDIRFRTVSLDKISKDFIKEEYTNILKKSLNDIFKYIETISKNGSEIIPLLNSWLFLFRDKMFHPTPKASDDKKRYVEIVREIIKTKDLILSTNINKRLALENLVLCIKN